jgi:hypothetical protein
VPRAGEPVRGRVRGVRDGLQAARAELEERRAKRPQVPGGVPRVGDDSIRIGVTALAALFSPLMGALPAGWFANDADPYAQIWGVLFFGI